MRRFFRPVSASVVASSSSLSLGLGAAADLAREEQRGADHEQDQHQHDRSDPQHFPVPKVQDARQRLSDHDKEQIRAAASNVKPRRRIDRPDAGIGGAFLQIVRAPVWPLRQVLPDDIQVERRPHDDRPVAAQHRDRIAGVEGEPAEQVMEISETDRAHHDAKKTAIGIVDAPAEHDRIGAAAQHRAAHVQACIGIGAMDLEILLVAAILRRRIEACRIVRQLALRVEHLDRAEMLGGGGMIEQDQMLDLPADAPDLRHHQIAGDVAQRQIVKLDVPADIGIDAGCEIFQSLAGELFLAAAHVEHDAGANRGEADHGRDRRRDQQLRRQSPGPAAGVCPEPALSGHVALPPE